MPQKQGRLRDAPAEKKPTQTTRMSPSKIRAAVRLPVKRPMGLTTVITRAIEVIGDEQEALRWLGTPVRALDYATPISRLNDLEGQAAVLNVLTQLEHGVL